MSSSSTYLAGWAVSRVCAMGPCRQSELLRV